MRISKMRLPTEKTLSVRQPYAQTIVSPSEHNARTPVKWIENRTWSPTLQRGDTLLIHASGSFGCPYEYENYGLAFDATPHGAIIGYVTFLDCIQLTLSSDSDKCSKHNNMLFKSHLKRLKDIMEKHTSYRPAHGSIHAEQERNIWHWLFADPVMLDEPICCMGKLNIWSFSK